METANGSRIASERPADTERQQDRLRECPSCQLIQRDFQNVGQLDGRVEFTVIILLNILNGTPGHAGQLHKLGNRETFLEPKLF